MAKDITTLRELITELERLSDNGKNDNVPILCTNDKRDMATLDGVFIEEMFSRGGGIYDKENILNIYMSTP